MEFLKSCSTNLQAVEGYSSIDYQIYNHADAQDPAKSQWEDQEQRHDVLLDLRQRGVLVQSAVVQKKVCVFGGFVAAEERLKELGWQLSQRGRLEAAALARPLGDAKMAVQNQHIFTMFLSAIEASLSISLQHSCGAVRVGHLTWLVPARPHYQVLSVRAQMTSLGTLTLLPHASTTTFSSASDHDGSPVLLAPSGTPATILPSLTSLSIDDDDAPPWQARREARSRLSRRAKDDTWKSSAASRLQHASIPHDTPWTRVKLRPSNSTDHLSCSWPESLCLEVPAHQTTPEINHVDSMKWFDSKHPYQNPLKSAQSWFLGQAEREETQQQALQAEKEKEAAAAQTQEPVQEQPPVASPLYSRSLQDQVNVNGIYPTPPDGLPPIVCAEPSASTVMAVESLPGMPEPDENQTSRRHSNLSDLAPDETHYRKGSTDDLFGDMDEEMFGNPNVTDADFNFFDDPGATGALPPQDLSETLMESIQDPTPIIEHMQQQPPIAPESQQLKVDVDESAYTPAKVEEHEKEEDVKIDDCSDHSISTPPLSPLEIKQKFLTSFTTTGNQNSRRDSDFQPVVFKSNIGDFDAKYRSHGKFSSGNVSLVTPSTMRSNSIALPPKPPKPRLYKPLPRRRATVATPRVDDMDSYEESDADTTQESESDSDYSADLEALQIDDRKRKRNTADDGGGHARMVVEPVMESDIESVMSEDSLVADPGPILDQLLALRESQTRLVENQHKFCDTSTFWRAPNKVSSQIENLHIWAALEIQAEDLIEIAQLVAEQSTFSKSSHRSDNLDVNSPIYMAAQDALKHVFSSAQDCDFAKVGAMASNHAELAIIAAAKSQQRPVPRRPMNTNSIITIPPPPIHVRRSGEDWEMQPTALKFWDSLSLEPAGGPKNVIAFAIYPDCGVVGETVADFLQDIRASYENCKLGSHEIGGITDRSDGLVPFRPQGEPSIENVLHSLKAACVALEDMFSDTELDVEKSIVIYMVNPFQEDSMIKYLCGCFQVAFGQYNSSQDGVPRVVLQILPINEVASPTSLIIPDQSWLNSLANFLYDRIPPAPAKDPKSSWQFDSWPSISYASPPTRKINFALSDRIPRNLLEEAHILHVGYAINADNSWLSAAWTDNSGKHHHATSYCLSNTDGKTILTELRDTTLAFANNTTFRIFVARAGIMRDWEKRVWREIPDENYSIALLDVEVNPSLQISGPNNGDPAQNAFMTPAATPQPSAFASPETLGAPSTPAGETPQSQVQLENQPPDPDAFLIDTTDETWGMLMPFSCTRNPSLTKPLASGLLIKRGGDAAENLPSLAVDLLEMIQPKVQEGMQGWLTQRAPETVLKECLVWYRGLGLLGRVRGVDGGEKGDRPWHVGVAVRGAEGLYGFLE